MKERRVDYEILRLIAIVCVIFNHTEYRGFQLYLTDSCTTVNYIFSLLLAIICKIAVPLFFIVSGGLLLAKNEPVRTVLKKRVLRIAVVLLLFSAVLYACWCLWGWVTPSASDFITRLWSSGISTPYWYLYTYLGLMLLLPLLRPMVQNMRDRTFRYLILLHLIFWGILPGIGLATGLGPLNSDFSLALAEPNLFYFILGYYMACRLDWEKFGKKTLGGLWGLAAIAIAVMFTLITLDVNRNGTLTMGYYENLTIFPTLAVYATIHQLCAKHPLPKTVSKILCTLGGCVFGAYLLEGIFRHCLAPAYLALEPKIHVLPACLVWVLAVAAAGLATTWILKKIPGLRRLL